MGVCRKYNNQRGEICQNDFAFTGFSELLESRPSRKLDGAIRTLERRPKTTTSKKKWKANKSDTSCCRKTLTEAIVSAYKATHSKQRP
jgi:hypothetical protein